MALKPCPFCGDTATVYTQIGRHGVFAYIECDLCGCKTKVVGSKYEVDDERFFDSIAYITLETAWNRRAT